MNEAVSRIYAPGPMQPIINIHEVLAILTQGAYRAVEVNYIESLPLSNPLYVNFGAIAAGGQIAKTIANILRLDDFNLLHLRMEPIDYVDVTVWELSGQTRFYTKNTVATVSPETRRYDPYLASTTFFIYGKDRDASFQINNNTGYNFTSSWVQFWGFRYLCTEIKSRATGQLLDPMKAPAGLHFTWLPAEGMATPRDTEKFV